MIYIKKQRPGKVILDEIAQIKSSEEWKQACSTTAIRACFDRLSKDVLRNSILEEQHYLCAYCMKRITASPFSTTIEHWYPLSMDKDEALNYANMIGVCKGGSSTAVEPGEKRQLCCDAYKGDKDIVINPQNQEHMRKIKYTKDGKIYTDDKILDDNINRDLRLNGIYNTDGSFKCDTATGLIKGRRDAYKKYDALIKRLKKDGKLTSAAVQKQIERIENQAIMEEFAGVVIFFLKRKYRSLVAQGR